MPRGMSRKGRYEPRSEAISSASSGEGEEVEEEEKKEEEERGRVAR
jgi:hypothetical protein